MWVFQIGQASSIAIDNVSLAGATVILVGAIGFSVYALNALFKR